MTANSRNEPQFTPTQDYALRGDTGEIVPKIDKLQGKRTYREITTAHNTEINLVIAASMLSSKKFVGTYLSISNREAYAVRVELLDDTTVIDEFFVGAGESLILIDSDGIWDFSTEINMKSQSGTAWSAGTVVVIGGLWVDT